MIATFIALALFGFTLNLLTLLALVLTIGLIVDDAIVVLENIHRRMRVYGETPLVAAYRGTRQIGFAVIATTLVIMLSVPLAMCGALFGLWLTGQSLNIYSQVGLVMLVGLAAKNGILIVEFANQLRDEGQAFHDALIEASVTRLRPILMTAVTTMAGAIPLIVSTGAGAETRAVLGTVILCGVAAATLFTLFVVPVAYDLLARHTGSPGDIKRRLERELPQTP